MDYIMASFNASYSFTWEIYAGAKYRDRYTRLAQEQRKGNETAVALIQEMGPPEVSKINKDCIDQFNPKTKVGMVKVANNWAAAFVALSAGVVAGEQAVAAAAAEASFGDDVEPLEETQVDT